MLPAARASRDHWQGTEIALLSGATVKWSCFKNHKRPHRMGCPRRGQIYTNITRAGYKPTGSPLCQAGGCIDRFGRPVHSSGRCAQRRRRQRRLNLRRHTLVLAASIMEDAHRSGVFTATVKDHCAITVPVPDGEHLDVFKLRDGPLIPGSQRKRAILHWVARHIRRQPTGISSVVKSAFARRARV